MPRKFGHPSAAVAYAVVRVELPDDHLAACPAFLRAVTASAKSLA